LSQCVAVWPKLLKCMVKCRFTAACAPVSDTDIATSPARGRTIK
jgi:hypothetical protein